MITASPFASGMLLEQTIDYHIYQQNLPIARAPRSADLLEATDFFLCVGTSNGKRLLVPVQVTLRGDVDKLNKCRVKWQSLYGRTGDNYRIAWCGAYLIFDSERVWDTQVPALLTQLVNMGQQLAHTYGVVVLGGN